MNIETNQDQNEFCNIKLVSEIPQNIGEKKINIPNIPRFDSFSRIPSVLLNGKVYDFKEKIQSARNGIRYIMRCNQRRKCNAYVHLPEKFDFARLYDPNNTTEPKMYVKSTREGYDVAAVDNFSYFAFNIPHKCHDQSDNITTNQILNPGQFSQQKKPIKPQSNGSINFDSVYFTNLVKNNSWRDIEFFKTQAKLDNKLFDENQLEQFLINYHRQQVINDENILINILCGRTMDEQDDKKQIFYQTKGDIMDIKTFKRLKYVIFATKFSLGVLSKSRHWYVNETYKCSPKGYKTIITIVNNYQNEYYYPSVYILLNSNKEILYELALYKLKFIMEILYNINVDRDIIINGGFELADLSGSSSIIKKMFNMNGINSYFFDYVKLLFKNLKKKGIFKSMIKHCSGFQEMLLLVLNLIILMYIDNDKRKSYFAKLYDKYKVKSQEYHDFLACYKSYWYENNFIKLDYIIKEDNLNMINDINEIYNIIFNQKMAVIKPDLSIFCNKLKSIEHEYRQQILKKFEDSELGLNGPILLDQELLMNTNMPFKELQHALQNNKECLLENILDLNQAHEHYELYQSLYNLLENCYKFIYECSWKYADCVKYNNVNANVIINTNTTTIINDNINNNNNIIVDTNDNTNVNIINTGNYDAMKTVIQIKTEIDAELDTPNNIENQMEIIQLPIDYSISTESSLNDNSINNVNQLKRKDRLDEVDDDILKEKILKKPLINDPNNQD